MRVLIVKTSSMGDVIHTLPALTDAATQIPGIRFDWVVEEAFAEIPLWHSAVNSVIPVAIRRWRKSIFSRQHWREFGDMVSLLRANDYHYVIDAQGLIKSALLTRLTHGERTGLCAESCRESLAAYAYDKKYSIDKRLHAIDRTRQLFEKSLNYTRPAENLSYNLNEFEWNKRNRTDQYLVFVHSASRTEKLWPVQNWVELASKASASGYRIKLIWGNEVEQQRAQMIAENGGCCEVLARLELRSVARLFQQASAVIGVDTGLSHLAAAIGVPAVTLYFETSPDLVGTRGQNQSCINATHDFACNRVKKTISVQQVWKKLMHVQATIY